MSKSLPILPIVVRRLLVFGSFGRRPSLRSRIVFGILLLGAPLLGAAGCSSEAQLEDEQGSLGAPLCELGDECSENEDCPVVEGPSVTTTVGITVSCASSACVEGRCVMDGCVCAVSPDVCCYPELGPDPEDFDGDWSGQGDTVTYATSFAGVMDESESYDGEIEFRVEEGSVIALEVDWIVPACEPWPPEDGAEPLVIEEHERLSFEPGELPITPYTSTEGWSWWSSAPGEEPSFDIQVSFDGDEARVEVDVSIFSTSPDSYSCHSGATSIFYDASRR